MKGVESVYAGVTLKSSVVTTWWSVSDVMRRQEGYDDVLPRSVTIGPLMGGRLTVHVRYFVDAENAKIAVARVKKLWAQNKYPEAVFWATELI